MQAGQHQTHTAPEEIQEVQDLIDGESGRPLPDDRGTRRKSPQDDHPRTERRPKKSSPDRAGKKNCEAHGSELLYKRFVAAESKQLILGIDGGATKTTWSLCQNVHGVLHVVEEGRAGPGSMKLLDADSLRRLLQNLPRNAAHVGVFLAGCATAEDRAHLHALATTVWPDAHIQVGSDRESGFASAFGHGDGIAVIAGTGSAVTGRRHGVEERAGGWGHLLGDSGGGYDLAIHALRRILFDFDTGRGISPLARDVLRTLGLNTLRDLTAWVQTAHKSDLARLTPLLFNHAADEEVAATLEEGATALAALTAAVAGRLDFVHATVRLMGGVFQKHPLYVELFTAALAQKWPGGDVAVCGTAASLGAAILASEATGAVNLPAPVLEESALHHASTEQSHPGSAHLDRLSARELVALFTQEEHRVEEALGSAADALTRAVEITTEALHQGGRLFYAGAGTSGRLGVLDASEMPPTFGVPPDLVQAIIAGGAAAIQQSVEGAEDHASAGAQALHERGFSAADVLCGITASGRTPFVRGALEAATALGAHTILLTCNPARTKNHLRAGVEIDLATGPELLTGSTRLKAGTATKVALNILSSCVMIRLGHVDGNFMSCLRPTNHKLRDRATRIVAARLELTMEEAGKRLECANWNIRAALNPPVPSAEKRILM